MHIFKKKLVYLTRSVSYIGYYITVFFLARNLSVLCLLRIRHPVTLKALSRFYRGFDLLCKVKFLDFRYKKNKGKKLSHH